MPTQLLKKATVLVVDDDADVLTSIAMLLRPETQTVRTEKNPERLPALLRQDRFDLILLDMNYQSSVNTGNEGLYWLQQVRKLSPSSAVLLITAYADIDLAVRALKDGASDFLVKPWLVGNLRMLRPGRLPARMRCRYWGNRTRCRPCGTRLKRLLRPMLTC